MQPDPANPADFRTTPEFAAALDALIEATQASDDEAVARILDTHEAWRDALAAEREFVLRVEATRPAPPSNAPLEPTIPVDVYTAPTAIAQSWLAALDATTTADRIDAALFTFETCAATLTAIAIGVYEQCGTEDESVATSLGRLSRGRSDWLDPLSTLHDWARSTGPDAADRSSGDAIGSIHRALDRPAANPAVEALDDWLRRLDPTRAVDSTNGAAVTPRGVLEAVLQLRRTGGPAPARGADAERTAERLEAAIGPLIAAISPLTTNACVHVRSAEPLSTTLFRHEVIDLVGPSPVRRRGGLLQSGRSLEPGRIHALLRDGVVCLHPLLTFHQGRVFRLARAKDDGRPVYAAWCAGEGLIERAVDVRGHSKVERLLLPRASESLREAALPGGGEMLGDFRALRQIGEGGMALVYLAEQRSIGREVALKVLHRNRVSSSFVERFRREGKAIGRLEHPNIVKVYAIGEEDGLPYLAMEYVHGQSLDGHLRSSDDQPASNLPRAVGDRSPMETTCRVVREVALALQHAHDHGIVHRDVKPGNILIDEQGHARLTDFGLAFERGEASLTMTGDVLGTPHYLSPEQVAAKRIDVDHRTDVYSLGVTLYQMLTGRAPFEGESLEQILRQIALKDPVPPRKLNPRIPRDLETICLHALEKDPDARYASAAEMAADLNAVTELRPIVASRAGPIRRAGKFARRRPAVTILSVALVAALLAWGTTTITRHHRDQTTIEQSLSVGGKLLDAGRPDKALPYFRRVLEVEPGHAAARQATDRILYTLDLERAYALAFDWEDPADRTPLDDALALVSRLERYHQPRGDEAVLEAQIRIRLAELDPTEGAAAIAAVDRIEDGGSGARWLRGAALRAAGRGDDPAASPASIRAEPLETPRDRLIAAAALMAERDWRAALKHYESVLRRGSLVDRRVASSQAARCCYWLGDYRAALTHLRFLESEHRTQPAHLLRRRAVYFWRLRDHVAALADLDAAIALDPDSVLIRQTRGFVRYDHHDLPGARADFDAALAVDADNAEALVGRGQTRYRQDEFDAAVADLDRALQLKPNLLRARIARAKVLQKRANRRKRRGESREEHADHNSALADLSAVTAALTRQRKEADSGRGRFSAEDRRTLAKALSRRVELYRHLGKFEFAAQDAKAAITIADDLGLAHYATGLISLDRGEWGDAITAFDRALELDRELTDAYANRAEVRYLLLRKVADLDTRSEMLDQVKDDLDRTLELEPNLPGSLINRAWVHLTRHGMRSRIESLDDPFDVIDAAEADARTALQYDPTAAGARLVLHDIALERGAFDLALDELDAAMEADPTSWPIHFRAAQSHEQRVGHDSEPGSANAAAFAFYLECERRATTDTTGAARSCQVDLKRTKGTAAREFLRGEEPATPIEHALHGFGCRRRGETDDARDALDAAVKLLCKPPKPNTLDFIVHKGALLETASLAADLGRRGLAIDLYSRLLALDEGHAAALDGRRRLKEPPR